MPLSVIGYPPIGQVGNSRAVFCVMSEVMAPTEFLIVVIVAQLH